jgi:transposase
LVLDALPPARELIADRGYDSNWFRAALTRKGIAPCIPSTTRRKSPLPYDAALYKQRHKIENMFGRLKDWRASTPATTDAPIPSSQPSPSPQPSYLALLWQVFWRGGALGIPEVGFA